MPIVEIKMWEGRTDEQKEKLIEGISKVFSDELNVNLSHLHIIITDVSKKNWGLEGKRADKL